MQDLKGVDQLYIKIVNNHWDDLNATYRVVEYQDSGISKIGIYKLATQSGREFVRELGDEDVNWMGPEAKY